MSLPHAPLLLALLAASACAKRPPTPWVANVRVEGPEAHGRNLAYDPDLLPLDPDERPTALGARQTMRTALKEAVTHRKGWWWQAPFGWAIDDPPVVPSMAVLREDLARVEGWFRDHGWPDASARLEVLPSRAAWAKGRSRPYVDVRFEVVQGPREQLGAARLAGDHALTPRTRSELLAALPAPGGWTSPASRDAIATRMEGILSDEGHAMAHVVPEVSGPREAREVVFHVAPGPDPAVAGLIVTGVDALDLQRLRFVLSRRIRTGKPWDGGRFAFVRDQLAAHAGIESVVIEPAGPAVEDHVGVRVRITEAPRRDVRLAAGLGTAGALIQAGGGIGYTQRHLAGRLSTLSMRLVGGYRLFEGPGAAFFTEFQHGPAAAADVDLEAALAPLSRLAAFTHVDGTLDTQRGYTSARGQGEAGFRWYPRRWVTLTASYQGGYRHYFPWPWQRAPFDRGFDPVDEGGYGLARAYDHHALRLALRVDSRPGGAIAERGVLLDVDLVPVGSAMGSLWHRAHARLDWHAPAVPGRFGIVTRLEAGFLDQEDELENGRMHGHRLFLGGPGSHHGFGFRRLGPPGSPGLLNEVMPGGDALLFLGLEGRVRLAPQTVVSALVDVGRTWESVFDKRDDTGRLLQQGIRLSDLQPAVGIGILSQTPIGGVEATLGVRLLRDTGLDGDVPWVVVQFRTGTLLIDPTTRDRNVGRPIPVAPLDTD